MIRPAHPSDAAAIAAIYNHYVENTVITFQEHPLSVSEMASQIEKVSARFPWLVLETDSEIQGYAYAAEWKTRSAYRFTVESTVYLKPGCTGQGLGSLLLNALIEQLLETDIHAVIGGIALPNPPSVALHEKFGFQQIGHFKEVGYKFGKWIDVGYWERVL